MKHNNIIIIISLLIAVVITTAPTTASAQTSSIYESEEVGYRLQIPQGWVLQDITQDYEEEYNAGLESGGAVAAFLCKETEALPGIGGTHDCFNTVTSVGAEVAVYPELQSRPEFEDVENITTSDLVALYINYTGRDSGAFDFVLDNTTDIDEFTKIVHMQYTVTDNAGTLLPFDDSVIPWAVSGKFVLSEDRNTGYSIVGPPIYNYTIDPSTGRDQLDTTTPTEDAAVMHEMLNSFELIE